MNRPLWQLLTQGTDFDHGQEFTCEECFLVLDYYADLLVSGEDPEKLRQLVRRHLAHCLDCREQFLQWLKRLEANQD